jgi:hypothetical protein
MAKITVKIPEFEMEFDEVTASNRDEAITFITDYLDDQIGAMAVEKMRIVKAKYDPA